MTDELDDLVPELARLQHEAYLESVRNSGEYDPDNRDTHRCWDELDAETQHANIDQVRHSLEVKLAAAALVAVRGIDIDGTVETLDETTVEIMAVAEHDRWCDHKRLQGWKGGAERDDARKVHDLLVPWDRLSEYQREKDREPCRRLPADLRRFGWSIVPTPE